MQQNLEAKGIYLYSGHGVTVKAIGESHSDSQTLGSKMRFEGARETRCEYKRPLENRADHRLEENRPGKLKI